LIGGCIRDKRRQENEKIDVPTVKSEKVHLGGRSIRITAQSEDGSRWCGRYLDIKNLHLFGGWVAIQSLMHQLLSLLNAEYAP
jgi:hypothetical protein